MFRTKILFWTSVNYSSGIMAPKKQTMQQRSQPGSEDDVGALLSGYVAPDAAPVPFVDADDASTVAIAPQDINPYFCFEIQLLNPIT